MYNNRVQYSDEFLADYVMDYIARNNIDNKLFQDQPELQTALRNSMNRNKLKGSTMDYLFSFTPFKSIETQGGQLISGLTVYNLWRIIFKIGTLEEERVKSQFREVYNTIRRETALSYVDAINEMEDFKGYLDADYRRPVNEEDYLTEVLVHSMILNQITSPDMIYLLTQYLTERGTLEGVEKMYPQYFDKVLQSLPPFERVLPYDLPFHYYVSGGKRSSKSLLKVENLGYEFVLDCLYRSVGKLPCESVRPSLIWHMRQHYDNVGHFCFLFRLNPILYMKLFSIAQATNTTIKNLIQDAGLPYVDMYLDEKFFIFGIYQNHVGIRHLGADSPDVMSEIMVMNIPSYNKLQPYLHLLHFGYNEWANVPQGILKLKGEGTYANLLVHEFLHGDKVRFEDGRPLNMLSNNMYLAQ